VARHQGTRRAWQQRGNNATSGDEAEVKGGVPFVACCPAHSTLGSQGAPPMGRPRITSEGGRGAGGEVGPGVSLELKPAHPRRLPSSVVKTLLGTFLPRPVLPTSPSFRCPA
jgi:hypothetical protein